MIEYSGIPEWNVLKYTLHWLQLQGCSVPSYSIRPQMAAFHITCMFSLQVGNEGEYHLKQLCVEIGKLNYVWPQLSLRREASNFAIVSDPPKIAWTQEHGRKAGG